MSAEYELQLDWLLKVTGRAGQGVHRALGPVWPGLVPPPGPGGQASGVFLSSGPGFSHGFRVFFSLSLFVVWLISCSWLHVRPGTPWAEKEDRALPCTWESAAPQVASRCPAHHPLPQAPGCCDPALLLEPRRVGLEEHRPLRGRLADPPGAGSCLSSGDEGQGPQRQPSSRRKGTLETRDPETWARVPGAEV